MGRRAREWVSPASFDHWLNAVQGIHTVLSRFGRVSSAP